MAGLGVATNLSSHDQASLFMFNPCDRAAISATQLAQHLEIFILEVQLVLYAELEVFQLLRECVVVIRTTGRVDC